MKRMLTAIGFWLLLAASAIAQTEVPLNIKGDIAVVKVSRWVEVKEDRTVVNFTKPLVITAPTGGILYQWQVPSGVTSLRRANVLEIASAPKGPLVISVEFAIVDFDKKTVETKYGSTSFDVGDVQQPAPPVTPTDPKPIPPPITLPGLRALIICETMEGPPALNLIISGEKVRSYMKEKGVVNGFLALDKDYTDADLKQLEPWVRDAYKRPRTSLPWIVISNGTSGFEGPLPLTNAPTDALNLLKKFGG